MFACLSASSCKDLPHDGTRGLFVTVDRSACPDVRVDSLMVGVYTQDGRLVKERRYSGGVGLDHCWDDDTFVVVF